MNEIFKKGIESQLVNKGIVDGEVINLEQLVDIVSEIVEGATVRYLKPTENEIKNELEKQLKKANNGRFTI